MKKLIFALIGTIWALSAHAQDRPVVLETTPRFFLLAQDGGAEAQAVLAPLLADELTAIGGGDVEAMRLPLWNDRVLLAASVYGGMAYGVSGTAFMVYAQTGSETVQPVLSVTGAVGWADLDNFTDGWPDLWLQNVRGINQPFGVWRWDGQAYAHLKNIPAQ